VALEALELRVAAFQAAVGFDQHALAELELALEQADRRAR
jgi:hypothetical protein